MEHSQTLKNIRIYHFSGKDVFEIEDNIVSVPEYTALFDFVNNGDASHLNEVSPLNMIFFNVNEPDFLGNEYVNRLVAFIQFAQRFHTFFQIKPQVPRKLAELIFEKNPEVKDKVAISFDQRLDEIDGQYLKVYTPKTYDEMISYFCSNLLVETPLIQQCKLCGNFFIPEPRNVEYCERFYKDTGKRCSEIGAQVIFKERRQTDEIGRLYDILYRRFVGRVQRGTVSRSTFDVWAKKAKEAKRQASQGEITFEEYKTILEDFEN